VNPLSPGTRVLTDRGERATVIRTYKGAVYGGAYAWVALEDGTIVDTPAASLLPVDPSLLDRLRHWFCWARFSWRQP